MPTHANEKETAFMQLSIQIKFLVRAEEANTAEKKFLCYIDFATAINQEKSFGRFNPIDDENLKFMLQEITSCLDAGINPSLGLTSAITYPELIKLLLDRGADPNFQNQFQKTPLLEIGFNYNFIHKERLLLSAELLVAYGANLNITNTEGKKPIELFKCSYLEISKEQLNEIETKFKQVTEHPRRPREIVNDIITGSTNLSLKLTEEDHVKIKLYRQGSYKELIETYPRNQPKHSTQIEAACSKRRPTYFNEETPIKGETYSLPRRKSITLPELVSKKR